MKQQILMKKTRSNTPLVTELHQHEGFFNSEYETVHESSGLGNFGFAKDITQAKTNLNE